MTVLKRSFLFILFVWVMGFGAYIVHIHYIPSPTIEKPDAIVVLTGGKNRIEEALELLPRFNCDTLFISGVNRNVTRYDILNRVQMKGTEHYQIDLGYQARNTRENAQEIIAWLKKKQYRKIILVTAYYHLPRSIAEFRALAPKVQMEPYAVFPDTSSVKLVGIPRMTWLFFKEYNKYLLAWVRIRFM